MKIPSLSTELTQGEVRKKDYQMLVALTTYIWTLYQCLLNSTFYDNPRQSKLDIGYSIFKFNIQILTNVRDLYSNVRNLY